jgi:uncharacterized OB-fold protein
MHSSRGARHMTPAQEMARHAASGRVALQHCTACGAVQYPPRELCGACLADVLEWRHSNVELGEVLAMTLVHHTLDAKFRTRLPLSVGLVRFDTGPVALCFLAGGCEAGVRRPGHSRHRR